MVVGGLDLAAYEHRCTGFAVIDEDHNIVKELICLHKDEEIINAVSGSSIEILAIDAPLIETPRFRKVDRKTIRIGFRVMPPSFKHMKTLTIRAWLIYQRLTQLGITVIETHPRSALKSSGTTNVIELCKALNISIDSNLVTRLKHKDLKDALISAVVALCYKRKSCIKTIEAEDGIIYLITYLSQEKHV